MSALVFALLFLIRVLCPLSLLLTVGEWVRIRESRYWFRS